MTGSIYRGYDIDEKYRVYLNGVLVHEAASQDEARTWINEEKRKEMKSDRLS
jgi:hypothetical protein